MSYQFKRQNYSSVSGIHSQEQDSYSTLIVEDLLQGTSDWREVKDIVKLTIRALTDLAKSHSEAIREIERVLPLKSTKTEVNQQLAQKANIAEVSRTVAEVAASVDNRICFEDLQQILKDFVSKNDLSYQLSNRVTIEEVRSLNAQKASIGDLNQEITLLNGRIEDLQKEVVKKTANQIGIKDMMELKQLIDQKANINDINESLEQKANKSSVQNALHRKVNKTDLEEMFVRKSEIAHLNKAIESVDGKAEYSTIEKLTQIISNKADKSDCASIWEELKGQRVNQSNENKQDSTIQNQKERERQQQIEFLSRQVALMNDKLASIDPQLQEIEKKPEIQDIEQMFEHLRSELAETFNKLQEEFANGVGVSSDKQLQFVESLKDEIFRIREDLQRIGEERAQSEEGITQFIKQGISQFEKEVLEQTEKKTLGGIEDIRRKVDELQATKLNKKEFYDDKSRTMAALEEKVDLQEVQQALNVCQADISARFVEYKEEMKLNLKVVEQEILSLISKKASVVDVGEVVRKNSEQSEIGGGMNKRSGYFKEIEILKNILDKIAIELESKMSLQEYANHLQQTKLALDAVQKDMILKANIKDVCALLDSKANIDDMNKALTEIYVEIDHKAAQDDINHIVSDQAIINESLCTENIVGRWTWKSSNLKQGNLVPWESQIVNTLPDNFQWEKDRAYIMCVSPGLYQVNFGFFCAKRPNTSLVVNGEVVLKCDANSGINQKGIIYGNHSSGNISGITLNEFLVLPEKARVSVVFEGDYGAEGFLGLKRL